MNTEQRAAETLLNKGIEVRVTAPLFLRAFGKKQISPVIRYPFLGTLHRMSLILLKHNIDAVTLAGLDDANPHEVYRKYIPVMAEIVAQAMLNSYWSGKLFSGILAKWLRWHITPVQLRFIAQILVVLVDKKAFMTSIRSVGTMTKTTTPNLSQQTQGS